MHDTADWPLAFDDEDRRPVAVMLHAFPLDRRMWAAQVEALAGRFRVVAVDLPGFGGSPPAPALGGLDAWTDSLDDLLDVLVGRARPVLVGLSMGGYVALRYAARYPGRLAGLVLADTRAGADGAEARSARDQAIFAVRRHGVAAIVDTLLPKLFSPAAPAEVVSSTRRLMLEQSAEAVAAALAAMRDRPDSTDVLAGLEIPVLAVVGSEDTLTPPEEAEAMARSARRGGCVRIPGAGHLANLEAPAEFNRALLGFLHGVAFGLATATEPTARGGGPGAG